MLIGSFAGLTFLTKNSFLDQINQQYVMTARAKGLTENKVLYGHVFRNSMLIVIAGFPAGTVTGAPKIRAMEIIDEVESLKRNIYSGAIGNLSWHGGMDLAIAIRTAVIKDEVLYVQAGAGIVYDSVPELEWQETMDKAQALIKAAENI